MSGLNCHLGTCDVQTCAAAKDQSGSMTLPQLGSVFMSVAHITTEGQMDVHGLGPLPEALLISRDHAAARAILI